MLKKIISYLSLIVFLIAAFFVASYYFPATFSLSNKAPEEKMPRIAIATNTTKYKDAITLRAVSTLQNLAQEYNFEYIQISNNDNYDWLYNIEEVHKKAPLDLLIGIGWEASEIFPIILSKYDDLHSVVIDNKIYFTDVKGVYFSRYNCSYIIGAMMAAAFPEENIFGYISNFETAFTGLYLKGYIDGLRSINPKAEVISSYTNNYARDDLAYKLMQNQHKQGIKFVMSTLSSMANKGLYAYAKEYIDTNKPIYTTCIGVDETSKNAPFILTGITINIELALRLIISDFLENGFNSEPLTLDFSTDGAHVLFASTQDVHYRNTQIITDEVINIGKNALKHLKEKN